jgi:hypothetical protein
MFFIEKSLAMRTDIGYPFSGEYYIRGCFIAEYEASTKTKKRSEEDPHGTLLISFTTLIIVGAKS